MKKMQRTTLFLGAVGAGVAYGFYRQKGSVAETSTVAPEPVAPVANVPPTNEEISAVLNNFVFQKGVMTKGDVDVMRRLAVQHDFNDTAMFDATKELVVAQCNMQIAMGEAMALQGLSMVPMAHEFALEHGVFATATWQSNMQPATADLVKTDALQFSYTPGCYAQAKTNFQERFCLNTLLSEVKSFFARFAELAKQGLNNTQLLQGITFENVMQYYKVGQQGAQDAFNALLETGPVKLNLNADYAAHTDLGVPAMEVELTATIKPKL